jgi:hypothetical protein
MKYINRHDTKTSHIYKSQDDSFYHPLCGVISIWQKHPTHAPRPNTVTDSPEYPVCKLCGRQTTVRSLDGEQ